MYLKHQTYAWLERVLLISISHLLALFFHPVQSILPHSQGTIDVERMREVLYILTLSHSRLRSTVQDHFKWVTKPLTKEDVAKQITVDDNFFKQMEEEGKVDQESCWVGRDEGGGGAGGLVTAGKERVKKDKEKQERETKKIEQMEEEGDPKIGKIDTTANHDTGIKGGAKDEEKSVNPNKEPGSRHPYTAAQIIALEAKLAGLMQLEWDFDKPLWHFHVMRDFKSDRTTILMRLHHALGDAICMTHLMEILLEIDRSVVHDMASRQRRPSTAVLNSEVVLARAYADQKKRRKPSCCAVMMITFLAVVCFPYYCLWMCMMDSDGSNLFRLTEIQAKKRKKISWTDAISVDEMKKVSKHFKGSSASM